MVTFLAVLLMVYTFPNLLGVLESAIMLQSSTREKKISLTAKLLLQGYRYHKLRKTFSKFYRRHYELISKFNVRLKTFLRDGLLQPEFYSDLVYKFTKLIGRNDFSFQFRKNHYTLQTYGYRLNVGQQSADSACLVFNPVMVDSYGVSFNCTPVGRASDSMMTTT